MKSILPFFCNCVMVIMLCVLGSCKASAQSAEHTLAFYQALSKLDSTAGLSIDTSEKFLSMTDALKKIDALIETEYSLITDSSISKSSMQYQYYTARKYGNSIRCTWSYTKKDLKKRWTVQRVYVTLWDTLFEEKKDLTGVNFGSRHNPVGTNKPIMWHTKFRYDSCFISLRGCSNMDGEDNFQLYTYCAKRKDTLCDIRVPCSAELGRSIYKGKYESIEPSNVFIKIYNRANVHFSPGACSAFLVVRPKHPKVVSRQKFKAFKIRSIK